MAKVHWTRWENKRAECSSKRVGVPAEEFEKADFDNQCTRCRDSLIYKQRRDWEAEAAERSNAFLNKFLSPLSESLGAQGVRSYLNYAFSLKGSTFLLMFEGRQIVWQFTNSKLHVMDMGQASTYSFSDTSEEDLQKLLNTLAVSDVMGMLS